MEKDSKKSEDSKKDKSKDKSKDTPDPNVKALQQKLTKRDKEFKKLQEENKKMKIESSGDSESDKKITLLSGEVEKLTKSIKTLNQDKEVKGLAKKYPDILPETLIGKSEAEQELIVKKQREITLKNYDEKPSAHAPTFKTRGDLNKAIQDVKEDRTIDTEEKMKKIGELKLRKSEF